MCFDMVVFNKVFAQHARFIVIAVEAGKIWIVVEVVELTCLV